MALSEAERERYGQPLYDCVRREYPQLTPWAHLFASQQARYGNHAAAVIAARDADLAATVRQWRDEAEQRRTFYRDHAEDGDFRDFLIREQALYDAFASVLQLLEGGDDGNG